MYIMGRSQYIIYAQFVAIRNYDKVIQEHKALSSGNTTTKVLTYTQVGPAGGPRAFIRTANNLRGGLLRQQENKTLCKHSKKSHASSLLSLFHRYYLRYIVF